MNIVFSSSSAFFTNVKFDISNTLPFVHAFNLPYYFKSELQSSYLYLSRKYSVIFTLCNKFLFFTEFSYKICHFNLSFDNEICIFHRVSKNYLL